MAKNLPVTKAEMDSLMDRLEELPISAVACRAGSAGLFNDGATSSEADEFAWRLLILSRDAAQLAISLLASRDLIKQREEIASKYGNK